MKIVGQLVTLSLMLFACCLACPAFADTLQLDTVSIRYKGETDYLKLYYLSSGETEQIKQPVFKGDDLPEWIRENFVAPVDEDLDRDEPIAILMFMVDSAGMVTDIEPISQSNPEHSDELARVMRLSEWEPAMKQVPTESDEEKLVASPVRLLINYDMSARMPYRMPEFKRGGLTKFRNWVMQWIQYPPAARAEGVQGTVVVEFIVDRDGKVVDITVIDNPNHMLTNEVLRVIYQSPKWTPGYEKTRDGGLRPLRVKFTLPINFVMH